MSTPEKDRWLYECHAQEKKDAAKRVLIFGLIAVGTFLFWFFAARAILRIVDPVDPPAATPTTPNE